mgnify:CR=1 FL=1
MTFVPKNIDTRATELAKIEAKKLQQFCDFLNQFGPALMAAQHIVKADPKEQLFIDLLQGLTIKVDLIGHPYKIYMLNEQQYMFEYDWQHNIFYCHYDRVWSLFETNYDIDYQSVHKFILNQVEKQFFFRPSTTSPISSRTNLSVLNTIQR